MCHTRALHAPHHLTWSREILQGSRSSLSLIDCNPSLRNSALQTGPVNNSVAQFVSAKHNETAEKETTELGTLTCQRGDLHATKRLYHSNNVSRSSNACTQYSLLFPYLQDPLKKMLHLLPIGEVTSNNRALKPKEKHKRT